VLVLCLAVFAILLVVVVHRLQGPTVFSHQGVGILTGRQLSWSQVLRGPTTASAFVFGSGLNDLLVPVQAAWYSQQTIDSSWLGAYAQSGLVGIATSIWYVLFLYRSASAVRSSEPERAMGFAVITLILFISIFESGMMAQAQLGTTMLALCYYLHSLSDHTDSQLRIGGLQLKRDAGLLG